MFPGLNLGSVQIGTLVVTIASSKIQGSKGLIDTERPDPGALDIHHHYY